jgi:hypothetical protein
MRCPVVARLRGPLDDRALRSYTEPRSEFATRGVDEFLLVAESIPTEPFSHVFAHVAVILCYRHELTRKKVSARSRRFVSPVGRQDLRLRATRSEALIGVDEYSVRLMSLGCAAWVVKQRDCVAIDVAEPVGAENTYGCVDLRFRVSI